MKAAVLLGPGDIRIEERSKPKIGPDDVLVRTGAVGVFGSGVNRSGICHQKPFERAR